MDQRKRYIDHHRESLFSMTELCERYGISRKTGYKWLERYVEEGRKGLVDRSPAPKVCPHRIADETAELICYARRRHPDGRHPSEHLSHNAIASSSNSSPSPSWMTSDASCIFHGGLIALPSKA